MTVKESPSTEYEKGTRKSSASEVTKGSRGARVGQGQQHDDHRLLRSSSQPPIKPQEGVGERDLVQKGRRASSKTVGQIPKDYTQGSGKLVSGTKATKAIEAALGRMPAASWTVWCS